MAGGVWINEPYAHALFPHSKDDIRGQIGKQNLVAAAPLNLIYVAHGERMEEVSLEGTPPLCCGRCRNHRPERLPRPRGSGRFPVQQPTI